MVDIVKPNSEPIPGLITDPEAAESEHCFAPTEELKGPRSRQDKRGTSMHREKKRAKRNLKRRSTRGTSRRS